MLHELNCRGLGLRLISLPGLLAPALLLIANACGSSESNLSGPGVLQILTTELPGAATTTTYSASLIAQGGVSPYTWSLSSGDLPPGLTLQPSTGQIAGMPSQQGSFSFVVRVRDASNSASERQLSVDVSNSTIADVSISLNGAAYQTWRAWRWTVRGNRYVDGTCARVPDAVLSAYLDEVVNNLGFTGIRLEQHYLQALEGAANDNADPFNLNMAGFVGGLEAPAVFNNCPVYPRIDHIDRTIIPVRSRVLARGEPFDLYLSFVYFQFDRLPQWWRDNVQEGAEAVEAYLTWFRQNYGFVPDWFTYNEPDARHFEANRWMGNLTVALGQRFAKMGVSTRIEQPSSSTPGAAVYTYDLLAGVTGAAALVKRVSFHGYDYTTPWPPQSGIKARNDLRSRARSIGAETAMTEVCCRSWWNGGYDTGLAYVRDMFLNMTEADISVWEPLGIYNVCSAMGCVVGQGSAQNLINLEHDLSTYYLNPAFWVARQFSQFIRPGYVRLGLNCSGCTETADRGPGVKAVAWKSPSGSIVVNLINDTGASITTALTGIPAGVFEIHQMDPSLCRTSGPRDRCTPVVTTATSNGTFTVTLPVNAVWTLRQR